MNRKQRRRANAQARKQGRQQERGPLTTAPANELVWSRGAREALGLDPPALAGRGGPARAVAREGHDIAHELFHNFEENDEAFAEDVEDFELDVCPVCGVDIELQGPAPSGALFGFLHPDPVCERKALLDAVNAQLLVLSRRFELDCDEESDELETRGVA